MKHWRGISRRKKAAEVEPLSMRLRHDIRAAPPDAVLLPGVGLFAVVRRCSLPTISFDETLEEAEASLGKRCAPHCRGMHELLEFEEVEP